MGALVMLIAAIILVFVLQIVLPLWLAIILAIVFLIAWFRLNIRAATKGLVRSNMGVYFSNRKRGLTHEDALKRVVATRYTISEQKQASVWEAFLATCDSESEQQQLKLLVFNVFCTEHGPPPPDLFQRLYIDIEKEYIDQSLRHGWPLS